MRIKLMNEDIVIEFEEGTGDNLLHEDIEAGYVDYVNYTVYDIGDLDDVREVDGGMILLEKPFDEAYRVEYKDINGKIQSYFDDEKLARDVKEMAGYQYYDWIWI